MLTPEDRKLYEAKYHEVVEICPYCENEVHLMWNSNDGFEAYCPFCGKLMMLCDECHYQDDYATDCCQYTEHGCKRTKRGDDDDVAC